jgi:hypothetical protein
MTNIAFEAQTMSTLTSVKHRLISVNNFPLTFLLKENESVFRHQQKCIRFCRSIFVTVSKFLVVLVTKRIVDAKCYNSDRKKQHEHCQAYGKVTYIQLDTVLNNMHQDHRKHYQQMAHHRSQKVVLPFGHEKRTDCIHILS